eukprot:2594478-Amphidinium_carterae.1
MCLGLRQPGNCGCVTTGVSKSPDSSFLVCLAASTSTTRKTGAKTPLDRQSVAKSCENPGLDFSWFNVRQLGPASTQVCRRLSF